MTFNWTTKEKIVLISDILEFGDQQESWTTISNDLLRTFSTNLVSSQIKKDGRYAIKNCRLIYKQLIDHYKPEWMEHSSTNGLKLPLAKYIWIQLKSIYQAELTYQLNESRKKLTEFCLQLENAVKKKSNTNESTNTSLPMDVTISENTNQENEQQEEKPSTIELVPLLSQLDVPVASNEPVQTSLSSEINSTSSISETSKEPNSISNHLTSDQTFIKDEPEIQEQIHIEISSNLIENETNPQPASLTISPNLKQSTLSPKEQEISHRSSFDSSSSSTLINPSDHSTFVPQSTTTTIPLPESASSSRSTSRTSSETKIDSVKVIPTTTSKYHVYFSPINSINNTNNPTPINKPKPKRKINDEPEIESNNQLELSSSSTEQTKSTSITAPMTRRSINTRSVPNTAAEQEEEKARRFSLMISENPNSWQSQALAIIQFIVAHKQGYLFEHEITDEIAPKYHQFIRRPIAVDTIRRNLESNEYQTKEYFKRDIFLMLYNAMKYNPRHHHVHRSARLLFNLILPFFQLPSQDIQAQIITKHNVSMSTDPSLAKRKRLN
ncbi:hypothetical protein I4U23_021664 [Adineta vaga]|nr:hypothetical protein I4U23_021664 [Adineta vaga]